MGSENRITFDPFCLDLASECLWRGSQAIKLRPKAFAVLNYLLAHPGQLVTKEELLQAVWSETFVAEAVLKVTIRQLRAALDDDSKSPRFIETAHRRGYRFIGQITEPPGPEMATHEDASATPPAAASYLPQDMVGRDEALSRMRAWLEKMLGGDRQIVFVTGEAGIGKTALVDAFVRSTVCDRSILIGRGQCLEHYGTSEAYLPVLEAIGRLCRENSHVIDVIRAHAPMWLLQMPSLVSTSDHELLRREVFGATRERMLREMSDVMEVVTADLPLVLILEDLHWSDYSTLDLISYLARQRYSARLMLIGTYRPAELIVSGHPLKSVKLELLAKQQCVELPLEYLSEEAVGSYLSVRFPGNRFPGRLAQLVHKRTDGNPLFMVSAVDYLVSEGLLVENDEGRELVADIENVEVGVPDSIKQMIEKQVDHLDAEAQRILEAASVAGAEFPTLAVAAGLVEEQTTVEARCEELARQRQFIQSCGTQELPNGEAVMRYRFIHTLYQSLLYDRVPTSRRVNLHRRIAEEGEGLYGARAREIAAELAMHFERGANYRQAVKYLQLAAENEILRFGYQEAVGLARRGLELLNRLHDTPERARQELSLQLTLGVPLIATEGYAAPNVGRAYTRARELCQQLGETEAISQVLWGLRTFHTVRGELGTARGIAEELLRLAEQYPTPGLAMRGHWAMEITFMHLGEFSVALEHFEKALLLYDPERHRDDAFRYAQNPGIAMRCFAAWSLWFLGKPDQAMIRIEEALSLARELSEPYGLALAFFFSASLHQLRREVKLAQERAEAALAVATEHGLALYHAMTKIVLGWALNEQGHREGIDQMREGIEGHRATQTQVLLPHFLALLAEGLGKSGEVEKGLRVSKEALAVVHRNGEAYYQAELCRIRGELSPAGQGEQWFKQAIKIAQQQKARSWELRAAMSLAHVRPEEARALLRQVYDSFNEGFDTRDLKEAREILDK